MGLLPTSSMTQTASSLRRCLCLWLSPRDDGDDSPCHHQHHQAGRHPCPYGHHYQAAPIPRCLLPGRDRTERGHALTTAFFDVGDEPWVVSIPDMKGRYFLLPFLDGWTNVFQVPGSRTTGTAAQTFVVTGPSGPAQFPAGRMTQLKAPMSIVWMLGRILHGHPGGLQGGSRAARSVQAATAGAPGGRTTLRRPAKVDPSIDMRTAVRGSRSTISRRRILYPAG